MTQTTPTTSGSNEPPVGETLIQAFSESFPYAAFVQIGSNDGKNLDPLHLHIIRNNWQGVLIEPIPYLYKRLLATYKGLGHRLKFENLAISTTEGVLPFYHLEPVDNPDEQGLPSWYEALGSFRREVIASHVSVIPDIEERIRCITVPTTTFEALATRHHFTTIDLLHIDAEGYDYEILSNIDLNKYCPAVIAFEHNHLNPPERQACLNMLASTGYITVADAMDTWCIHTGKPGVPRDLIDLWRSMGAQ